MIHVASDRKHEYRLHSPCVNVGSLAVSGGLVFGT